MRILTAGAAPVPRADDFCDASPGEVVVPHAIVCSSVDKAQRCGCDRSHVGISSHQRTTTVCVAETDWDVEQLVAVYREHLIEAELDSVLCAEHLEQVAQDDVAQSIEVAGDHPLGAILRPRYDHAEKQWFYDDAGH